MHMVVECAYGVRGLGYVYEGGMCIWVCGVYMVERCVYGGGAMCR